MAKNSQCITGVIMVKNYLPTLFFGLISVLQSFGGTCAVLFLPNWQKKGIIIHFQMRDDRALRILENEFVNVEL